ncbi:MAG: peptidylprolyl isomerase [Planctomycetota bacterium]
MMVPLLFALIPCLLPLQEGSSGRFAEINGQVISRAEFSEWLLETHGWRHAEDFTILVLFRQEAARLGIVLEPDALEQAFQRFWNDQVLLRYAGDEKKFLDELAQAGIDQEGYRRRHWAHLETQELGRRIILKTRAPEESALKELFNELFPGGKRVRLQIAFFNRFRDFKEHGTPTETALEELDAAAKLRADRFVEAVREHPDRFAALAKESADLLQIKRFDEYVRYLRDSASELPYYNKALFRGALEPLLDGSPGPGELLGPVFSSTGFYVVRVVRIEPVEYDAVVEELREQFRSHDPTGREIYGLRVKLLEQADIDPPLRSQ